MSALYGINSLPCAGLMWLSQPLFRQILNGGTILDADFVPVSVAFAVFCFATVGSIIFIALQSQKLLVKGEESDPGKGDRKNVPEPKK